MYFNTCTVYHLLFLFQTTNAQIYITTYIFIQGDTKKRELLKNPTKIEEIHKQKFIDRN
jgi:hypothetical protein